MVTETAIHYNVAQAGQGEMRAERRHSQAVALNQFRNAHCDYLSMADLLYYAGETGKDIHWLFRHGKFRDPAGPSGVMAENAYRDLDVDLMELILMYV